MKLVPLVLQPLGKSGRYVAALPKIKFNEAEESDGLQKIISMRQYGLAIHGPRDDCPRTAEDLPKELHCFLVKSISSDVTWDDSTDVPTRFGMPDEDGNSKSMPQYSILGVPQESKLRKWIQFIEAADQQPSKPQRTQSYRARRTLRAAASLHPNSAREDFSPRPSSPRGASSAAGAEPTTPLLAQGHSER